MRSCSAEKFRGGYRTPEPIAVQVRGCLTLAAGWRDLEFLRVLQAKRVEGLKRKHGNIPL